MSWSCVNCLVVTIDLPSKNARLVAEWEQAELERKVKRSEIRSMWILFWPFFGGKVP